MSGAPRLAFALVCLVFAGDRLRVCAAKGDRPLRQLDAHSEANSSHGAERLVAEGGLATSFLPRYEKPSNLDSGSEVILESDIYTHYLPGPDYVLALAYALFGTSPTIFRWTRLVPLAHVIAGAWLFLTIADRRLWRGCPWARPAIAAFLLFTPAVRDWALSLHGHAYSSSYVLVGATLGMVAPHARRRLALAGCAVLLGFLSNYMLLTAAFVVCAAPLAASLLVPEERSHRPALALSLLVGLGLVAAFGLHFAQVVRQFGLREAWLDQAGVLVARSDDAARGVGLLELLAQYEAGVQGFFGLGALAMLAAGLWLGWCHRGPGRQRVNLMLAALAAAAGSWAWILLMRGHAIKHAHVNPRIFLLSYLCCLAAAGIVSADRVRPGADAPGERP